MFVGCSVATEDGATNLSLESPRLQALAQECSSGNSSEKRAALEKFWKEMEGNGPLVEPIASDNKSSLVTFLWQGDDKTRRVNLAGGPTSSDGDPIKWLTRLANTDLWYRTQLVPNDARVVYLFQINRPVNLPADPVRREKALFGLGRGDPLNQHAFGPTASMLEMSDAPAQPWLEKKPSVLAGKLSDEQTIESEILKQTRSLKVYTTPGYETEENEGWLLVLFDGEAWLDKVPTILDNLTAEKKIPKLTALFVYQTAERDKELGCSKPFADFLADELMPWMRKNYHVGSEASHVIIGGASRGGLMAAYCAFRHPEVFGNVLSMSGSYWWSPGADEGAFLADVEPGWLSRQYVESRRLPIRFFLSAGRFETGYPVNLLAENRRYRDVLLAKGYSVEYNEYNCGHAFPCWYKPLVDGLIELTGSEK